MTHPTLIKYYRSEYETVGTSRYAPMILSIIGVATVIFAAIEIF